MKKARKLYISVFCILFLFFASSPVFSAQTFVVISDVVFERENPSAVSVFENMTLDQLHEAYWRSERFPSYSSYYYYGQNLVGEIDKSNPTVIRTTASRLINNIQKDVTVYVDIKKLWPEPPLSAPPIDRHLITQNTDVYLLPDSTSRKVLSLYQGEVVEVVGSLNVSGVSWSKARFCNEGPDYDHIPKYEEQKGHYEDHCSRYGYVQTNTLKALLPGSVNESKLTTAEIPRAMRNSALTQSETDQKRLVRDGFYLEEELPSGDVYIDDMVDRYQGIQSPRFITADLYLHVFHLMFDRMLQDIEEETLYPEIGDLTKQMVKETQKEFGAYTGKDPRVQKAIANNLFFFSVAAKLLDSSFVVPVNVRSDVMTVVEKIIAAEGPLPSLDNKIALGDEDFTQYRPRGHYENHDLLERYFRGMMWYGRHAFLLSDDSKTISAILIAKELETSGEIKRWTKINAGLTRLIGKIDDWSPADYSKVTEQVFGTRTPRLEDISNDAKLKTFKELAMKILPVHRIVSVQTGVGKDQRERLALAAGFKFLGQRFTPDAYYFNQLTSPAVGSIEDPRNLPTALDVMSILGSSAADALLNSDIRGRSWENVYRVQAGKLRKEVGEEIGNNETAYGSWLQTLTAMLSESKSRQLFSMSEPWRYKVLNTALSSWTELKHDTILYSEQSYAEKGSGDEFEVPTYEPPYVKGYVEPNPLFFSTLLRMATTLRTELLGYRLVPVEYDDKLQTFAHHVKKAYDISKKEVDGDTITRDDYRWIEIMSNSFDRALLLPGGTGDIISPDMLRMALIADIATDAVSGRVLEAAIGVPQRMIVAVKDASGGTRICTGYVYSWYEFADVKRWTDKEWKDVVYSSDQSAIHARRPSWYSKLLK